MPSFLRTASAFAFVLLIIGCTAERSDDQANRPGAGDRAGMPTARRSSVPLRVAVYRDQSLADQIALGWQGVSEQAIEANVYDGEKLADVAAKSDMIVMPARRLAEAASEHLITPFPKSFLDSEVVDVSSWLAQLRLTQMTWAEEIYGLSLGSPVSVAMIHDEVADVPEDQPLTYEAFTKLAAQASGDGPMAAEPLAQGQAAESFLRRAASNTDAQWLFDSDDLTPLLDQPSYVRALEQMIELRQHSPEELLTAEQIWQRITAGKLKVALGWPTATVDAEGAASVRILPTPYAAQVFTSSWQPNPDRELGYWVLPGSGYVVTLSSSCRQNAATRSLAAWMTREGLASLRRASSQVTAIRPNDDNDPSMSVINSAITDYDGLAAAALASTLAHPPLRLVAVDRYMKSLDEAILQALAGKLSAVKALEKAKDDWIAITQEVGAEKQLAIWTQNRLQ